MKSYKVQSVVVPRSMFLVVAAKVLNMILPANFDSLTICIKFYINLFPRGIMSFLEKRSFLRWLFIYTALNNIILRFNWF